MKKILMSCVALMLMSAPVLAEETKAPPAAAEASKEGKPELRGPMAEADTDKDGKISKAEFTAKGDKMFAEMDKNGDGFITPDEMKAHHEAMKEKFKERRKDKDGEKPADAPEPPPAHQ